MTLELDPTNDLGRNSGDDRACRNVTRHNCPRADDSTVADGHSHADHGVSTDEHVVADGRWPPLHLGELSPSYTASCGGVRVYLRPG